MRADFIYWDANTNTAKKHHDSPYNYGDDKPAVYRGFEIYQYKAEEYHLVKDGYILTMMVTPRAIKAVIDRYLDRPAEDRELQNISRHLDIIKKYNKAHRGAK